MNKVGIDEFVDMVYDIATKTKESVAKKVLPLMIEGYASLHRKAQDIHTKELKAPVSRPNSRETTKGVKRTTRKRRKNRSSHKRWSATELSILRSRNLNKRAKIAELKKVGRSRQAIITQARVRNIRL